MFKKIQSKFKLSEETINFVKTIFIVAISFVGCYLLFIWLDKIGMFDKGYTKPENEAVEISYEEIFVGMVFNRPEKEYFVAFDNFGNDTKNIYFDTLLNMYSGEIHIYKVDMTLGINQKNFGEVSNTKATNSSELSVKSPTLIKIKNGKIDKYYESVELIEQAL